MSDLRGRIIAAISKADQDWLSDNPLYDDLADAVIRELAEAVPPIVASAIQGYAQSGLAALSHHGDDSAIEELKRLNKEALQIAQYATTHEDWNGGWKRYE